MLPPAPARLSITTCWPSALLSACAVTRANVSPPPPADEPTIKRIDFAGYSCGGCCAVAVPPMQQARQASRRAAGHLERSSIALIRCIRSVQQTFLAQYRPGSFAQRRQLPIKQDAHGRKQQSREHKYDRHA